MSAPSTSNHRAFSQRPLRRLSRLVLALATILFGSAASSQTQEPVYGLDDGPRRAVALSELSPDIQPSPYFETWDFWMWSDEGHFVVLQFVTSSFGYGIERQGSARLIVVDPGATNFTPDSPGVATGDRGFSWADNDWGWDEEPLNIRWIDCYLRGDGQTFELFMRGRDRRAFFEATLELDVPLHRPGDGRLEYGWDRHRFYDQIAFPRYRFTGRVNRKEGRSAPDDWVELSGVGYGEHTLTNDLPYQVAQSFTGFRALRGDGLTIVADTLMTPIGYGNRTIGWALVALDGAPVFEATEVIVVPVDVRPYEGGATRYLVPYGYRVEARNGDDWMIIEVNNAELVSAESPFARVSAFLRGVLSALMAPYDFELAVDYEAWVHIGGQTAQVAGRGWSTINFTR